MVARSLAHTIAVLAGKEPPHTQTTAEEQAELVRHLPGAKIIVEIGVYEGATTALFAARADPDAVLYGIDPMFPGRLGICWGEVVAKHVNRRARLTGRVRLIKRFSHEAVDLIPGPVDFIFIDGDHSLEGIRRDWETWSPRIRPGGIVALHDSFPAANSPASLGSHRFYADSISRDERYFEASRQGSLAVLRRKIA